MLPHAPEHTIANLPALVDALPPAERGLVMGLFAVVESEGSIVPPPEMAPWLERHFGSVDAARHQRAVRVLNRWTFEGASFNPLRARRPGSDTGDVDSARLSEVRARIDAARGDDFCDPEHRMPADVFGRVRGRHSQSAANVARADAWHSVVVFDEHDPLAVDTDQLADALAVARTWAGRAHATDPQARHLFVLWNCLWRAGASQAHGHLQMLLGRAMAQARVELWRAAARSYAHETGRSYFADLAAVHLALGLGHARGPITIFASLTPIKEREVVVLAPGRPWGELAAGDAQTAELTGALGAIVAVYRQLGVLALNAAVFGPPLGGAADWEGFPTVARLVDRGDPLSSTADVAAMELFGSSVVASDPFALALALAGQRAADQTAH